MSLEQLATKLTENFNKEDYEACHKLLTPIKIELIEHNLLVPSIYSRVNPNDLLITRSILEIGALVSINLLYMNEFSNYIVQLKPFYEIDNIKSQSNQKNKLLSLYLLSLLTQDDLAMFHIELENFQNYNMSVDDLEQDEYLSIPIKFEKWIIDGDFNKVYETLSSKHKFPCKEFNIFEPELLTSIRLNIANSLENVYKELPIENLKLLLFLKEIDETKQFIENFNWNLVNGVVYFSKKENFVGQEVNILDEIHDEKSIIKNSLIYASEMERII
jgi:26S proteasome regulatory subunit N12